MRNFVVVLIITACSSASNGNKIKLTEKPNVQEVQNHFVKFNFKGETILIEGKSDIESDFYLEKFPNSHTKESVKKLRLENRNIFCGRISNLENTRMIEIFYNYDKNTKLNIQDLKKEVGNKRYTFNYDTIHSKPIDKYFRLYFFNDINEYTSDSGTEGYIEIQKINSVTDSTITAEGIFNLNIREYGNSELTKIDGSFNLEFYIGL